MSVYLCDKRRKMNIQISFNNIKGSYTNIPLPEWQYLPGINQHPDKQEKKHIPKIPENNLPFTANNWQQSVRYLYAIDLFNAGYYWEVHEVLEYLWKENGKTGQEAVFLKGIIQLAVALLKVKLGNLKGAVRLKEKALSNLNTQKGIYLGIDVDELISEFELFINKKKNKLQISLNS